MSLRDDADKHAQRKAPDAELRRSVLGHADQPSRNFAPNEEPVVVPERPPVNDPRPTRTVQPQWDTLTEEGDSDGVIHNEAPDEPLPDIDYTNSGLPVTPEGSSIYAGWAAVMAEVQQIKKNEQFRGGGAIFNYRGVDAVLNAVGPAFRKHRIFALPINVEPEYRDVEVGSKNTPMRECLVKVTYLITGAGYKGTLEVVGRGESLDTGDKGTTKAMSVAFRNMLLTALAVPVDDPQYDAERTQYHRAAPRPTGLPTPASLRNELLHPKTSFDRAVEIYRAINPKNPEARFPELGTTIVKNENDEDERLASLAYRTVQKGQTHAE